MTDQQSHHRLITRPDFDGVVSAVLLRSLGMIDIDDVLFVDPKSMQDGRIAVTSRDITSNLPYVEGAGLAFDHHASEVKRVGAHDNLVNDPNAPSAARVIYQHFGGAAKFPSVSAEMLAAVDKSDTANYSEEDILAPDGWTLLSFLMDPRTGLDRVGGLSVSQDEFMRELIVYCQSPSIDEILELPAVRERLEVYIANQEFAERQIRRCAAMFDNLVVVDLRAETEFLPCNRFMVYGLYPEANISITVNRMADRSTIEFAVGKSILNRTARTNIGDLMLEYGGGGHAAAGTCRADDFDADVVLDELIRRITAKG